MKNPKSDPELYAACLEIISAGLADRLFQTGDPAQRATLADAAATLVDALSKAVTP
jgi:hypothetical protein